MTGTFGYCRHCGYPVTVTAKACSHCQAPRTMEAEPTPTDRTGVTDGPGWGKRHDDMEVQERRATPDPTRRPPLDNTTAWRLFGGLLLVGAVSFILCLVDLLIGWGLL